jgi:uncharacterized transporter YbjL
MLQNTSEDTVLDETLAEKVNAAKVAVNVITLFGLFIALFTGVMLGIFNSTVPDAGPYDFALGFSAFFFGIGLPCLIFQQLVRKSIAQAGLWNQSIVWFYAIILLPLFPMGTAAACVIIFAQVSWMRARDLQ